MGGLAHYRDSSSELPTPPTQPLFNVTATPAPSTSSGTQGEALARRRQATTLRFTSARQRAPGMAKRRTSLVPQTEAEADVDRKIDGMVSAALEGEDNNADVPTFDDIPNDHPPMSHEVDTNFSSSVDNPFFLPPPSNLQHVISNIEFLPTPLDVPSHILAYFIVPP